MVDIPGNSTTTATISVGGTASDTLEIVGDHDWFKIDLTAGQSISVLLDGISLEDAYLRIYDSNGNLLVENDDINPGIIRDSKLSFTASYTGTYYIDVGAWEDDYAGTYQLSVSTYTPPPVATMEEIADQLVNGYWGGDDHHFNVTQGGSITVNLSGLTAAGKTLATAALQTWTDIIGVNFIQVASGGQIVFNDDAEGAYSDSNWSGGIITSSIVNVSTDWLATYGTGLNSYSYQTYIHEIGHALGLGHAGNYNGEGSYPYDALFLNDSWSTSVMSYFSQTDNSYFAGQFFTENYVISPMMADILAMSVLYGLSTTTRVGDTTYGPGWTADMGALCLFDSGGTDTIDCSTLFGSHLINLNAGTFSNIMSETGNISIAYGVTIENAVGGDNSDMIVGNSANNVLNGGGSILDTVSYEAATAGVVVSLLNSAAQNTVGAGVDTLLNFEMLKGSSFNDDLTGRGTGTVHAGDGNDIIRGATGQDRLYGEGGNDTYTPGSGFDIVDGGTGWDKADFSAASSGVTVDLANSGPNSHAFFYNFEEAVGSAFNDQLTGTDEANIISGLAGNDTLVGYGGDDTLNGGAGSDNMSGGSGSDSYIVDSVSDVVTENSGEGIDLVTASASFTLGNNVENLTLSGSAAINGTGNSLANAITGNSGANSLDGGSGADQLAGGLGDDIYFVDQAGDVVSESAGEGTDEVRTSLAYVLGSNVENLRLSGSGAVAGTGNALANTIRGNDSANALFGLDGADKLYGNGGDDALEGGNGDDYLYGLVGNDSLTGGAGYDRMYGGVGDDTYYASDGDDYAYEEAGEGTDQVIASVDHQLRVNVENLTLAGSAFIGKGNDLDNSVTGTGSANKLYGYAGNDILNGGGGDDYLFGDVGNDALIGGAGYDRMYGGAGDDSYFVNDSTDHAYENVGEGHDRVVTSINLVLRANIEQLELGGSGDLRGWGNSENNLMLGNSGNNLLYGRDGNDALQGNAGNDILYGENGDDGLLGGVGQDRFYGGAGADDFIFDDGDFAGMTSSTAERIHDFAQGLDQIDLGAVDANSSLADDQAFAFIGTAAFTGVAGQLRYQQISGNTYVQGDVDGDGTADFWIRLDGLHGLQGSDFII